MIRVLGNGTQVPAPVGRTRRVLGVVAEGSHDRPVVPIRGAGPFPGAVPDPVRVAEAGPQHRADPGTGRPEGYAPRLVRVDDVDPHRQFGVDRRVGVALRVLAVVDRHGEGPVVGPVLMVESRPRPQLTGGGVEAEEAGVIARDGVGEAVAIGIRGREGCADLLAGARVLGDVARTPFLGRETGLAVRRRGSLRPRALRRTEDDSHEHDGEDRDRIRGRPTPPRPAPSSGPLPTSESVPRDRHLPRPRVTMCPPQRLAPHHAVVHARLVNMQVGVVRVVRPLCVGAPRGLPARAAPCASTLAGAAIPC